MINSHAIYIEKLQPDYKTVFKKIRDYVRACNMDEIRNEEMLSEVMDTFLSAQSEGKPVEQVIGGDLRTFCRELCSNIGIKSRIINFLEAIHPIIVCFAILSIIDLIKMLLKLSEGEKISFLTYRGEYNIFAFLLGGLIVIIVGYIGRFFVRRLVFTRPDTYKKLAFGIRVVTFVIILAAIIFLFNGTETEGTFLWISLLCCTVFLTAYRFITRQSRQYKKENRISLLELAAPKSNIKTEIEEMEMNRFMKLNKKNTKKGKPELSFDQFLEKEEKNCNSWDKRPSFYIFLTITSTVIGFIFTLLFGGFEGWSDISVFIAVLFFVESVIMYGIYRFVNAGTNARQSWIKTKRGI